ncbi:methyltransferase [Pseudidiomarina homiensis]|uniref:Uncharacterized protein n=1 Tax=Pseudidiomarina homiensis TaxID=364198 RepID=A0A432Y522_9GAMM|nr:methyltransferase [Pseudidiomarina homiensis]RUO55991.1 hypothetical protein CWI70_04245 [Pseudidiomarina homiensis]
MAKSTTPTSAPSLLVSPAGRCQLKRYPLRTNDPLQAWDAADELLHQHIAADVTALEATHQPLVLNDQWGALLLPFAHCQVTTVNDSFVSQQGQLANLALNQLSTELTQLDPLATLPQATESVWLKIPKSQSLLEFQLAKLSSELQPGTPLRAAAKSKLFTPAVRELFAKYCDEIDISLIQRKCRVLTARVRSVPLNTEHFMSKWQLTEHNLTLHHHVGVFARNQLDIGARLLLDNLPEPGASEVIDLGCGNGVLGLVYAQSSPSSAVTWVDESHLAVASCRLNIEQNLATTPSYRAVTDDCLSQFTSHSVDLVLCNPPFHQEHAITEHIARQMFRDAKRVLRKGGEMRLVANRHLPYYHPLKRLFKQVKQVASNAKFVVYSCLT